MASEWGKWKPVKRPGRRGADKIENYATTGLYEPPPEDAIYCKSYFQILSKPTKAVDALQFTYKGPRFLE